MLVRSELPGGVTALISEGLSADGFLVAFTERSGGTSTGRFRGLNLGARSDDDARRVMANRRLAAHALGIGPFACAVQVHGVRMTRVGRRRAGAGFDDPSGAVPAADALITSRPGTAISMLTADCVPIALADPRSGALAVIHAGWRGTAAGIVARSLEAFEHPAEVRAAVGPAIGVDHYEVGEEVAAAVAAATERGALVRRHRGARPHLDLPGTVARILRERGVRRIERADECTACDAARFYSYRRDGVTGRQAVIASRL